MKIIEKRLKGVYEIILEPKKDNRGFFMRTYDSDELKEYGLHRDWVQENHSLNLKKGTVRGLHFQFPPFAETKLVRIVRGSVFDAYVDLRENSPTFGKWESIILSEENNKMLYLPGGFAHGICTLENKTIMLYKMDNPYSQEYQMNIKWNDSDIGIRWPLKGKPIISERDFKAISFKEFLEKYGAADIKNLK